MGWLWNRRNEPPAPPPAPEPDENLPDIGGFRVTVKHSHGDSTTIKLEGPDAPTKGEEVLAALVNTIRVKPPAIHIGYSRHEPTENHASITFNPRFGYPDRKTIVNACKALAKHIPDRETLDALLDMRRRQNETTRNLQNSSKNEQLEAKAATLAAPYLKAVADLHRDMGLEISDSQRTELEETFIKIALQQLTDQKKRKSSSDPDVGI